MLGDLAKSTESAKDLDAILKTVNNTIEESGKVFGASGRVITGAIDDISRATVTLGDDIDDMLKGVENLAKISRVLLGQ